MSCIHKTVDFFKVAYVSFNCISIRALKKKGCEERHSLSPFKEQAIFEHKGVVQPVKFFNYHRISDQCMIAGGQLLGPLLIQRTGVSNPPSELSGGHTYALLCHSVYRTDKDSRALYFSGPIHTE